ncbi:MAG: tRNA (adenosine(37)-N6)-dimethylallyltransferase MiaA [Gammaproteobacteria bacterium]|nr:MAG: tRNA (adenosine(37)-N6)-dimethylallyltransferase MiaA [Gammaproteobacteria bacterium]
MPSAINFNNPCNLIVILGATATGKTRLAVELAKSYNGEIISADSRQVYKGMDIGTGKDLNEYGDIPYHLIDIFEPGYQFNVYEYQKLFFNCFEEITDRGKRPILVGGTGLYIQAVLDNYNFIYAPEDPELRLELNKLSDSELTQQLLKIKPEQHNTTDTLHRERTIRAIEIALAQKKSPSSTQFPEINPLIIGIKFPRPELHKRITQRLKSRVNEGMFDEVKALVSSGVSFDALDYYGLEYRYVSQLLQKKISRNDMLQKLNSEIKRFAKKQETYFKRMEKQGHTIHWLNGDKNIIIDATALIDANLALKNNT